MVEDRPLAFCDFRSINPEDLVATDKIYPHRTIEMYHLLFRKSQRWYWISQHKREEVLLMVMYDSMSGAQARRKRSSISECGLSDSLIDCPHASFHNPDTRESAPPRESVETRSLVIERIAPT
jgi:hypothetical protein